MASIFNTNSILALAVTRGTSDDKAPLFAALAASEWKGQPMLSVVKLKRDTDRIIELEAENKALASQVAAPKPLAAPAADAAGAIAGGAPAAAPEPKLADVQKSLTDGFAAMTVTLKSIGDTLTDIKGKLDALPKAVPAAPNPGKNS